MLFASTLIAQAQQQQPDLQRELTLEKAYTPNLRDADKLSRLPEPEEPEASGTQVDLSNFTLEHPLAPYFLPLGVRNHFPRFSDNDTRGYLSAGLGTPINFDWDAGYQIVNTAASRLSLFASERITHGRADYLQDDRNKDLRINDLAIGMDLRHHLERATLSADVKYDRSAFNYYGRPPGPYEDWDIINQTNNRIGFRVGFRSTGNQKMQYRINALYTNLSQREAKRENRIVIDGGLFTPFRSTLGVGLDLAVKNYAYFNTEHYTLVTLNPYFTLGEEAWNLRLGAKASPQFGGPGRKLTLSPDIRLRWQPDEAVLLYLIADGGVQDNSLYNTFSENRYLHPDFRVRDSKSPLDARFGVAFSPALNLGIDLFTGYKWVKDEHFYYTLASVATHSPTATGFILPEYADATVFQLGGTLQYQYQDLFDLRAKLVYNRWNLTNSPGLFTWNKPVFTGDWALGVKIPALPLRIDVNYHLETGRKAREYIIHTYGVGLLTDDNTVPMKNIHDVSTTLTYPLTKNLSIYAKANNLLFQQYDLWYGHPAQGFYMTIGGRLRF
jgi:hypothetical protein